MRQLFKGISVTIFRIRFLNKKTRKQEDGLQFFVTPYNCFNVYYF